ncbi:hypothetical protein GCM10010300_78150 [Streptomyces olivaceoviridis]|nr:hypothetical protein GCM10010300_78150 [Streptomyces olivaceoviridis]
MLLASAGGNRVPVIAQLVRADEDTVRDLIPTGLACPAKTWSGKRSRTHGCCSVGDAPLWGVDRRREGTVNTLAALKSSRAARPDGAPIHIILDDLSAHTGATPRRPRHCTATRAGATPTPATPTYSPPNARNAPASAARRASAGADAPQRRCLTDREPQPRSAERDKFTRRTATGGRLRRRTA